MKIYLVCGKTYLRKGIDGLAALVTDMFGLDACDNAIFLFCGSRSDRFKALYGFDSYYPCHDGGSGEVVNAPDCGSGTRGFDSHLPPLLMRQFQILCRCGGIGRRAGLKIQCPLRTYRFDPDHRYQNLSLNCLNPVLTGFLFYSQR